MIVVCVRAIRASGTTLGALLAESYAKCAEASASREARSCDESVSIDCRYKEMMRDASGDPVFTTTQILSDVGLFTTVSLTHHAPPWPRALVLV